MSRIAFLSMDNLENFFVYDSLLIPFFNQAGYSVDTVSWHNEQINWNDYTFVIVRSPWDYQQYPEAFVRCLERIDSSSATLQNPLALMKWNIEKTYLIDLQRKGVPVIPTQWADEWNETWFLSQFDKLNTQTMIIKPALSANADDTFKVSQDSVTSYRDTLSKLFSNRKLMVQPFVSAVQDEGEYSLFYFAGEYSHTILKQPKAGDFRVQEEHGGRLSPFTPTADMREVSQQALDAMPSDYLYARIDLIRRPQGWAIMELELIEPSLYFNIDDQAAKRFVDLFVRRYGQG